MSVDPFHSSMTRISDLESREYGTAVVERERWATGDYVVSQVRRWPRRQRLELPSGRLIELAEGDRFVGALGVRHATLEATGSWREVGEDGVMSLLTGGGLMGKCTSRSDHIGPLPKVVYRGHVVRGEEPVRMDDFVELAPGRTFRTPTVLVVGTSMSAGKTTAARVLVRRLKSLGLDVLGAKLAGAGRYRDILTMGDAGADYVFDFVDAGLPSTVHPRDAYADRIRGLLGRMAGENADAAVIEVGASPLEPYNGDLAVRELGAAVRCRVLCASDPYAVIGVMKAWEFRPDLVTGIAANTLAGVDLVEELAGVPAMDLRREERRTELDRMLRETLEL
jgi:hypothetical protein